jgi:hypothetical protein
LTGVGPDIDVNEAIRRWTLHERSLKIRFTVLPAARDSQRKVEREIAALALLNQDGFVLRPASALNPEVDPCRRVDQNQTNRNF